MGSLENRRAAPTLLTAGRANLTGCFHFHSSFCFPAVAYRPRVQHAMFQCYVSHHTEQASFWLSFDYRSLSCGVVDIPEIQHLAHPPALVSQELARYHPTRIAHHTRGPSKLTREPAHSARAACARITNESWAILPVSSQALALRSCITGRPQDVTGQEESR